MKRLDQKGFSLHIIIGVVAAVALVGVAGLWIFLHNKDEAVGTAIYTDTAEKFTFEYPAEWTITDESDEITEGDNEAASTSHPVTIEPLDGSEGNVISVNPGCEVIGADGQPVSVLDDLKGRKDPSHTQQESQIGDYSSFYDRTDLKTDAESYVKHVYFVTDGVSCVTFSFTESHQKPDENIDFDDGHNTIGFEEIVNSIQFL